MNPKTKHFPRDEHLPLNDAKLALDIAAIRDQISKLCADLRGDSRDKPQEVLTRLNHAQNFLNDALCVALTVAKS
jgi:hypothetical protein